MRNALRVGDIEARPGEVARGSLGAVEIADGSKAMVPLLSMNGGQDGPILTVVSGVHGTELSSIGALLAAIKKIDPATMRGALLGIPGANPVAIRAGVYVTPIDGTNLSGPWFLPPVNQDTANTTQRIASCINEALEKADYVLDMHANPLPSIPFVLTALDICQNEKVREETRKMADVFGVTIINTPRKPTGSIRDICVSQGKPSITAEMAGDLWMSESITSVGTRGILNVMKAIGMLDGEPEKQDIKVIPRILAHRGFLISQRGGFMYVKVEPGEKVPKGQTVIEISNVYGDVVQEVTMPIEGYCLSFTGGAGGTHAVSAGMKLAFICSDQDEIKAPQHSQEVDGKHEAVAVVTDAPGVNARRG